MLLLRCRENFLILVFWNKFKPCLIKDNVYEAGQSWFLDVFFEFLGLSIRFLLGGNPFIVHKHKTKDCARWRIFRQKYNLFSSLFAPLKFAGLHNHSPSKCVQTKFIYCLTSFHLTVCLLKIWLGYLKDRNAAVHSDDSDISYAVIHLPVRSTDLH